MDDETKKETQELVNKFNDPNVQEEVKSITSKDPLEQLRYSLFTFFQDRLQAIEKEDEFEQVIKDKLEERIQNDEVSIGQLMQLYDSVKGQSAKALDVLLDVFKPSKEGNISPIVEQRSVEQTEAATGNIDKNLEPDQRDNLNKIINYLETLSNQKKGEEGE